MVTIRVDDKVYTSKDVELIIKNGLRDLPELGDDAPLMDRLGRKAARAGKRVYINNVARAACLSHGPLWNAISKGWLEAKSILDQAIREGNAEAAEAASHALAAANEAYAAKFDEYPATTHLVCIFSNAMNVAKAKLGQE